jgi:hypothetical protein
VNREYAHLILGLAALRRGEREVARDEMRAALASRAPGPCGFFPPNALLALELLESGDREAMLEFLESARNLVPDQARTDRPVDAARARRTHSHVRFRLDVHLIAVQALRVSASSGSSCSAT